MESLQLITIQPVSFAEILSDADLIAEYAAECSISAIGPINPQPAIYAQLESAGIMQCFGAFVGFNLAGFASVLTTVLPHYGRKVATLESLFVAQKWRSSGVGIRLMRAVEQHGKDSGCVGVLYSAPAGGQLERVLDAKGYMRTNAIFYRGLE